jgi:hypothetical protein
VLAPALDVNDLHQLGIAELEAVPTLLARDRDPGDRGRVAIEPVDRGHIEQIFDVARGCSRFVEAAGAERIDVVIDLAPQAFVRRAEIFQPIVIGHDQPDRFSV